MSERDPMAAAPGSIWRGRSDAGELGDTRRLFNVVR